MVRSLGLLASLTLLVGCSSTTEIGKSETNATFPEKSQASIEAEVKKDPAAWAAYQESQRKDAAYRAAGKTGR